MIKMISIPTLAGVIALSGWAQSAMSADEQLVHQRKFDTAVNIGIENFKWQEYDGGGQRLLTEQGPRLILGASLFNRDKSASGLLYDVSVRGYIGKVDYDGQDSLGVYTSTDTSYRGLNGELTGGYRWETPEYGAITSLDFLLSLGADVWRRDINDSTNALGFPISGFVEDYTVYYGKIGVGASWPHQVSNSYFQIGAKKPISVDEDVDVFNVTLSPSKRWSAFASYTLKLKREGRAPFVKFYYDSYRFGRSPSKVVGTGVVWQPESDLDVYGVVFGYIL